VIKHCKTGWPDRKEEISPELKPYWKAQGKLTVNKHGLLLFQKRIVVPKTLQRRTLKKIHAGHQGIQRCRLRANTAVWWPGISHEIENMVQQCHTCAQNANPRKQQVIATELPDYPWQKVATDLFHYKGVTYIAVVDYFSRYPEVQALKSTTSESIIKALKNVFSRHGIPEAVCSDNGPQYTSSKFAEFAISYDFKHVTSSPHFPQSNGQIKRTVQTVKRLFKESKDPHLALLVYRSTPFPWCKLSPAELLMGRRIYIYIYIYIRSNIPLLRDQLTPNWKYLARFREHNKAVKHHQKQSYDKSHGVHPLNPIPNNSDVWITSGDEPVRGTIGSTADTPHSYIFETPSGQVRRNRQHLNVVPRNQGQTDQPEPTQIQDPIMTRSRTGTAIVPPNRL